MQLSANNICFGYDANRRILRNVNFHIKSGEIIGLTGPSGCGKTTLARVLGGYNKPNQGEILLNGVPFLQKGYNPVQLVFQHPERAVNPKWKMKKVLEESLVDYEPFLEPMGIQKEWLYKWPHELSGGELQRFCVLRILSAKTKFIIADEMTTMLDTVTQAQIWQVVLSYARKQNMGVVVISHDQPLVHKICTTIVNILDISETTTNNLSYQNVDK